MRIETLPVLTEALKAHASDPEALRTWATEHLDLFDEDTLGTLSGFAKSVEEPGQFGFALRLFDLLVFVWEQRQQPQGVVNVLLERGELLERLGILDDALDGYERALRTVTQHALGQEHEYDCLVRKASVYQQVGLPRRALPLLERTVELARASGSLVAYEALGNLAVAHDAVGDYERALALHQEALRGLRLEDELLGGLSATTRALAIEYLNTGLTYAHLGRDEEALGCFRESAARFRRAAEHAGIDAYGGIMGFAKAMTTAVGDRQKKPHPFALEEATALIQLAQAARRLERADEACSARDQAAELVRRYSLDSLVADLQSLYQGKM